jgi:hypothetical protein
MKTFKYNLNGQSLVIRVDEKNATIADLLVDGEHPVVSEEEMPAYAAAIALALISYEVVEVHDEEPGVITLTPTATPWAAPSALMNQLKPVMFHAVGPLPARNGKRTAENILF